MAHNHQKKKQQIVSFIIWIWQLAHIPSWNIISRHVLTYQSCHCFLWSHPVFAGHIQQHLCGSRLHGSHQMALWREEKRQKEKSKIKLGIALTNPNGSCYDITQIIYQEEKINICWFVALKNKSYDTFIYFMQNKMIFWGSTIRKITCRFNADSNSFFPFFLNCSVPNNWYLMKTITIIIITDAELHVHSLHTPEQTPRRQKKKCEIKLNEDYLWWGQPLCSGSQFHCPDWGKKVLAAAWGPPLPQSIYTEQTGVCFHASTPSLCRHCLDSHPSSSRLGLWPGKPARLFLYGYTEPL